MLADGIADDWGDNYSYETIGHLKNVWNANVIRIPIHPAEWEKEPDYLAKYVDKIVDWAGQNTMYVVVGWHAHGNPVTGETEAPLYNPDLALAKSALETMVSRYKDCEWVRLDPFPNFLSGPPEPRLFSPLHLDIVKAQLCVIGQ